MTPVVTLNRDQPLHPWLRTPDELRDHLAPATPGQTYRRGAVAGLTHDQASTLAAWRAGVNIDESPGPWPIRTLNHLLFLRDQVECGRLAGDTEAN